MNISFVKFNTVFIVEKFFMEKKWKELGAEGTFSERYNLTKKHGLFK